MSLRARARLAWSLFALDLFVVAVGVALELLTGGTPEGTEWGTEDGAIVWVTAFLTFPIVVSLIASRVAGGAIW